MSAHKADSRGKLAGKEKPDSAGGKAGGRGKEGAGGRGKGAGRGKAQGKHGQVQSLAAELPPPPPIPTPEAPVALPPPPPTMEQTDAANPWAEQEPAGPTSRVCVKNLPKYITEASLRKHFAAKGEVTDIKIMKTREGQSRQLGFVGFKTVEMAVAAQKYFNKTFVDATRIEVEFARKYHDPSLPRPWSKHSEGSSAHQRAQPAPSQAEVDGNQEEAEALAKKLKGRAASAAAGLPATGPLGQRKAVSVVSELEAQDPKLAEFLALMAPRSRAHLWANDEVAPAQTLQDLMGSDQKALADGDERSNEEECQMLAGAPGAGKPWSRRSALTAVRGITGAEAERVSDVEQPSSDAEQSEGEDGAKDVPADKDQAVVSEAVSDMDYLKSRMKKWKDEDEDMPDAGLGAPDGPAAEQKGPVEGKQAEEGEAAVDAEGASAADQDVVATGTRAWGSNGNGLLAPDPETAIRASSRLFVRNLAFTATEADLLELCGKHGDVTSVHLVIDRQTKMSRGIAYVLFVSPDEAVAAYRELDGLIFQGRLLHILPALAPPSGVLGVDGPAGLSKQGVEGDGFGEGEGGASRGVAGSSYKTELDAKRKENAGNRAAWNSLFMRADTVQEAVAAHYGISKAELMDVRASNDVAVRVALGEAAIIQQTKAALAEQGVNVATLEAGAAAAGRASATRAVARSPNTLLVKNLPFTVTEEELRALFTRSGPVVRLVLPPAHTLALVEWAEPQDARTAFRTLAYKRFHQVPLFLEWAPQDVFNSPAPLPPMELDPPAPSAQPASQPSKGAGKADKDVAAPAPAQALIPSGNIEDDDGDEGQGATIYVKNLAFATVDAGLKKHFDKVASSLGGSLLSVRVAKRAHPTTGDMLSAGFGFVEVSSAEVAGAAIQKLQGSMLDHHKLSLQLSKRKSTGTAAADAQGGAGAAGAVATTATGGKLPKGATTKLVVRNVAFETTRKDIASMFSPFGHLKSCRLPKKFDGNHRGFAFVEFVTKQEAHNALEGVSGTHLLGRRLVVEYAKEEGGLDELRAKTASKSRADEDVLGGGGRPAKKMKRTD